MCMHVSFPFFPLPLPTLLLLCVLFPPHTGVPVVEAVSVSPVLGINGMSATLQFSIALPPVIPVSIEWRFNPISGPVVTLTQSSSVRYNFSADMLSLSITGLVSADEGTYTLIASTLAGSNSAVIYMFVQGTAHVFMCNIQV